MYTVGLTQSYQGYFNGVAISGSISIPGVPVSLRYVEVEVEVEVE